MSDEIRIERREGWRKLVLNRPDKLNAANEALLAALLAALDDAEADRSCRALLLTGEGRGFCAGQELGPAVMPGPNGPPDLGAVAHLHHRLVRRLHGVTLPVVCAVNGVAAGAGASYALACDIVLAGRSAQIHPGVREDRPGAGFRCQLLPAAADRRGACPSAGDARRDGGRRTRGSLGHDLARRR